MSLPFRLLLLVNAIATLAAGIVLFAFPGAIPATVGISLAPDQAFVARLLGASEFGIAALCIGALRSSEPAVLRLTASTMIVFHAASAIADMMALLQDVTSTVALNLVLRIAMIVLFALIGLRRTA